MIRLATVFSGIGSIEHALDRMNIPHEIVFACDNGDIAIKYDQKEELEAIKKMPSKLDKKNYVDELYAKKTSKTNYVKKSYMANYPIEEDDFHLDICLLDGTDYTGQVDLLVGGSPCQSFSIVGHRKGLQDHRGTLIFEFCRIIQEVKPKVFIYENVKGLLNHDQGKTWEIVKSKFESLEYKIFYQLMNAKDYGIPQNRERLFVVGFKDQEVQFTFPKPFKLEFSMKDFLEDSVDSKFFLPEKGVNFVTKQKNLDKRYTQIDGDIALCQKANQQFNWHGDFVSDTSPSLELEQKNDSKTENPQKEEKVQEDEPKSIQQSFILDPPKENVEEKYFLSQKVQNYVLNTGTKNFYSKPKVDLDIARPILSSVQKMHRAGIDNYISRGKRLRKLTPKECLRLMGFDDSFKIVVSDTQMYRQAGNSIVVNNFMEILNQIDLSIFEE